MKRFAFAIAAFAAILGLSGCELLTNQQNLFAGLEPDLTAKYSASVTGGDLLAKLAEDTDSSSFYEDLSNNPTLTDQIVDNLDVIITTSSSSTEVEAAALYKSEIVLNTSEAGDVVNSLVDALTSSTSGSSSETALLESVLSPVDSLISSGDSAAFTSFINTMLDLKDTYDALALANTSTGTSLSADVAQAAAVVLVVDVVVNSIVGATTQDKINALYNTLVQLDSGNTSATLTMDGTNIQNALLGGAGSNDSTLEILLNSAGLSNLTSLISQMGS